MALIIEGDMPTKCCLGNCPIHESCNKYDSLADTRPFDCPILGEIPDEHGRLIDADALIKRNRESKGILEEFKGDPTLVKVGYKSVIWEIKDLENAPTIVEASVVEESVFGNKKLATER